MRERNNQSLEDYLETILIIRERQGYARSVDVAKELGVTKPSVSVAMKKLKDEKYITMDCSGHIFFTDKGMELAEMVYNKHRLLYKTLVAIGVDEETAASEACLIEHIISDKTYKKINDFYKKLNKKS